MSFLRDFSDWLFDPKRPTTLEDMIEELEDNGWKRYKGSQVIWQAPNGGLYIGPAGAWGVMKNREYLEDGD